MKFIRKARREWFGGIVYSESPSFTAFVDSEYMDRLGVPNSNLITNGIYSAPLDVHLSITNRCSLHCRGCYANHAGDPARDMPLKQARDIIDRLAQMNVFTVAMGGGEPFLNPEIFEIAAYCRSKQIVPNVTTNGLLIDSEMAAKCEVFGCVHVSCHCPSDLSHIDEPIRLLRKAGLDVGLNLLVSSETYDSVPDIWFHAAKLGVSRILLLRFKLTEHNRTSQEMLLSPDQERQLIPTVKQLARKTRVMPMLDCSFFPSLAIHSPKKKDVEFFDINGCVGANAILAITLDGQFKPCSFWSETCGDALDLNPAKWAMNEKLNAFRKMTNCNLTRECSYFQFCQGGCRVVQKNESCQITETSAG